LKRPSEGARAVGLARLVRLVGLAGLVLLAACSSGTGPELEESTQFRTLRVNGEYRSFLLHVPEGVESRGAGLILAFHGWGMSGSSFSLGSQLDGVAKEVGAIIAYPDAVGEQWAEDCDCVPADRTHLVGDTAFVAAMIRKLTRDFHLDPERRYALGYSQGGLFAMRVACQMTDRIAAVVEVASTISIPLAERCEPSRPISVLTILSQQDGSFPWEGTELYRLSLGAEATAALWAEADGCSPEPEILDEEGVFRLNYSGCSGGTRVRVVGPEDGGHFWTVSPKIDTGAEVASFLGG